MKQLSKIPRRARWIMFLFIGLVVFIFLNNTNLLAAQRTGTPFLLAHRGLGQTFDMAGITGDTCTATRIFAPEHPYLENSIPSMEAAFAAGAHMVELDIRPTKDGQFAVFHDWTLDCRTEASGLPSDYTLAQLQQLDVGYGYTHDGGQTYAFRGQGVGLMPGLDEVLARFPDRRSLIHIKSNDAEEGVQLAQTLAQLPLAQQQLLAVYGGNAPIAAFQTELPDIRAMSVDTMKACLIPYVALGWSGYVAEPCREAHLHIPEVLAPWLWGWPNKFLNRMDAVDTRVILLAGQDLGGWSQGFDTIQDLERLPADYTGGIWTNRIDRIGPRFHNPRLHKITAINRRKNHSRGQAARCA